MKGEESSVFQNRDLLSEHHVKRLEETAEMQTVNLKKRHPENCYCHNSHFRVGSILICSILE